MMMIECLIAVIVLLYIAGAILMSCFIKFSGAEPGGLEIPFWPVTVFIAFFDAMAEQIRRAIKERKKWEIATMNMMAFICHWLRELITASKVSTF
ncbi:hypothetical protein [Escherichia coli]|uniref:hypothetical protein n=1 Tax=Escherichia coli TaxID=562 RepID=UPI001F2A5436|nr:hypothetical protein [Escherichia coli]